MSDMVEILREQGRHDIADEIERLRARILELEATVATLRGSMAGPDPAPVGFGVTYDIPPSTPR